MHGNKGKKLSKEHKKKLSESHKGIIPKILFLKGHIPWNKNKKNEYSLKHNKQFKKDHIPWNKGKEFLQIKGENNPKWKGGITPENIKSRQSLEYAIWRMEIFKKDNFTCRFCKKRGGKLVAHHLQSFSEFPELRFSVDNGITLCRSCHSKLHNTKFKKI